MIGAFVSIISLNLTLSLVQDWGVYVNPPLAITAATVTTPIVVTVPNHGWPPGRPIHGVVSGVVGMDEANGLWVLTYVDADSFSLTAFDAQGNVVNSVGANPYVSGGEVKYAFPDGAILLGRRNMMTSTSVVSPRVVFVPTRGKAWSLEPYGGAAPDITGLPRSPTPRGSAQQQAMTATPQLATEFLTFEVYVNGSGPNYGDALDPDFADFDATQAIVHALYAELFDANGAPRAQILSESWPSQDESQGAMTQRGQQWMGVLEIPMPVRKVPVPFVPVGVTGSIVVQPKDPLVPDDPTTIPIIP